LKRAVLTPPRWSPPVGLGANLTLVVDAVMLQR